MLPKDKFPEHRPKIGHIRTALAMRKYARGFVPFYNDVLNLIDRDTMCEFGVSGGAVHLMWAQNFNRALGIDLINYPGMTLGQTGLPMFTEGNTIFDIQYWTESVERAIELANSTTNYTLEFKFGYDAYNVDDVTLAMSDFNVSSLNLVVDDGATSWPLMKDCIDVWRPYIHSNGIFVTETPDGNGTPDWRAEAYEEHMEHFAVLAEKGVTVLDLKSFQPDWAAGDEDWESTFIGFWSPNPTIHDIIMAKYGKYKVN